MRYALLILTTGCASGAFSDPPRDLGGVADDASQTSPDLRGDMATTPSVHTGVLVGGTGAWPGAISGVRFSSGTQSGVTDAQGTFAYQDGQPITFTIGDVTTAPVTGAAKLSPFQLAGSCAVSQTLKNLLVLLDSLDADHDLKTGIALPAFTVGATTPLAGINVAAEIQKLAPGTTAVDEATALHAFIAQVDGELWNETGSDTFTGPAAAQRSQGVTTDGQSFIFSWRLGLEKTDTAYNEQAANQIAIPILFAAQGSNHIGDIDFYNGKIYAPVEDSAHYAKPMILLYDPGNLSHTGTAYNLPQPLQTKGVPWVAVDGPRGRVITAEWDPTPSLNFFDLNASLATAGSLTLSRTLGRIQGAKVYQGMLYAQADDTQKTTYKINLETGTVIDLFTLGRPDVEAEGLLLWPQGGALMHTLNTDSAKTAMELHHRARTRDPLRLQLCP